MAEIEIGVKAKIFDDPEYCEKLKSDDSDEWEYCDYLNRSGFCQLFGNARQFKKLKYDVKKSSNIKCHECKDVWQKAKDGKTVGFKTFEFQHSNEGAPKSITLTISGRDHEYRLRKKVKS